MTLTRYIGDRSTLRLDMQWMRAPFIPDGDYFLLFTVKDEIDEADDYAKIQKTTGLGITEETKTAIIQLERDDTIDLAPGVHYMDIVAQHTIDTDDVRHVFSGELHLHRPVTQKVQSSIPIITTTPPVDFARLTIDQLKQYFVPFTEAISLSNAQLEQFYANQGIAAYDDLTAANASPLPIGAHYYDRALLRTNNVTA